MLKRCPHCGGEGLVTWNYSCKTRLYYACVKCDICGAQGKTYSSSEEPATGSMVYQSAINSWNMRYTGGTDDT